MSDREFKWTIFIILLGFFAGLGLAFGSYYLAVAIAAY